MKTLAPLTLAGALAAVLAATAPAQDDEKTKPYELGSTVDETLELKDVNGKVHSMKEYRGKTVVLHFWSATCPYMKPGSPKLEAIAKDYAGKDVVSISICSNVTEIGPKPHPPKVNDDDPEPYESIKKFCKKKEFEIPVLVDHGNVVADRFQARTTPHCFVIDAKGVIRYVGALDDDPRGKKGEDRKDYVRMALDDVLAAKDVRVKKSKPYGCSIKRIRLER